MKPKPQGIEAITVRRAVVVDADKVRYRVYSSPTEFIAVIAESALMAVRVSGISKPHKIVRDLPTDGIAIEAKRIAAHDASAGRVAMNNKMPEKTSRLTAEIPAQDPAAKSANFKPIRIAELQRSKEMRARILSPELLNEIIEQHSKASLPLPPADEPIPPAAEPAPSMPEPSPVLPPANEPTSEERVLQMAEEMLPSAPTDDPNHALTPEEVEKLLNG